MSGDHNHPPGAKAATWQEQLDLFAPWLRTGLFACACLLFIALASDRFVYLFLGLCGVLSLFCLFQAWRKADVRSIPWAVFLPLPLILYDVLLPGQLFSHIKVSGLLAGAYITGLGVACFLRRRAFILPLCLLLAINVSFFYWLYASPAFFSFGGQRLQLLFNHPNVLAAFSAWGIFFIAAEWPHIPHKYRLLSIACTLCPIAAILLTAGRSAYIGIILTVSVFSVCQFRRYLGKTLVASLILLGLGYAILPPGQQQRMRTTITKPLQDPTFRSRVPIWKIAAEGIEASPWLGHEYGAYRLYHQESWAAHQTKIEAENPGIVFERIGHPHNLYLWMLFTWGIAGVLLFLLAIVPAIRLAIAGKEFFFLSSLLFTIGYGIFDTSLHNKDGAVMLFFPLGLVYGKLLRDALFTCAKNISVKG